VNRLGMNIGLAGAVAAAMTTVQQTVDPNSTAGPNTNSPSPDGHYIGGPMNRHERRRQRRSRR
jgi:hypothetical protein